MYLVSSVISDINLLRGLQGISIRDAGSTYLHNMFFLVVGRGSTPEPPCRHFAIFLHCCRNLNFSPQFQFGNNIGYGDESFSLFFGASHRPLPVRCNGIVFASKIHSTTEFAMTVLSKCVRVCLSVTAKDVRREP